MVEWPAIEGYRTRILAYRPVLICIPLLAVDKALAEIEAIVEPDGLESDIWWESVPFVGLHGTILSIWET